MRMSYDFSDFFSLKLNNVGSKTMINAITLVKINRIKLKYFTKLFLQNYRVDITHQDEMIFNMKAESKTIYSVKNVVCQLALHLVLHI